jgi:DNA-directed RNA polymerase specialized sigma24 family protein
MRRCCISGRIAFPLPCLPPDQTLQLFVLQVELVAAVCASARDIVRNIQSSCRSVSTSDDTVCKLLQRLHDCASTAGFLSLASAAAAYLDSIVSGRAIDRSEMGDRLSSELARAEAEWDTARSHLSVEETSTVTRNVSGPRRQAAESIAQEAASAVGCFSPDLRAAVVRRYLEERP